MRTSLAFVLAVWFPTYAVTAGALVTGCRASVETTWGAGGEGRGTGGAETTSGAIPWGTGGHDGGNDALADGIDPGCPDAATPPTAFTCDPYTQFNGDCPPGEGCYLDVRYPPEFCGQEVYGSVCQVAGTGQQGAPCHGTLHCGAGLVCVVSGAGNQCVQLCPLQGPSSCPPGLVCEPIDVEGFGGCL